MLWPLLVYMLLVVLLAGTILLLSYLLGEKHKGRVTGEPYESGIAATKDSAGVFHVKYYMAAMFFLIFDVESVFIYIWAVSFEQLGWAAMGAMTIFIAVLFAALVYVYKNGAFEF